MWYVICLVAGLAVGAAFLFWALSERRKRHDAEMRLEKARVYAGELEQAKQMLKGELQREQIDRRGADGQIDLLRKTLEELRKRLVMCKDPATIRNWLDSELGKQI